MSAWEKVLDGITKAIRIEGRVEQLAVRCENHQLRIENLTERIIRLETMVEMANASRRRLPRD
jgi:hypothetical protein